MIVEQFKQYISQFIQLSEIDFRVISDLMSAKKLRKKEHFVKINDICSEIVFLVTDILDFITIQRVVTKLQAISILDQA